MGNMCHSRAPKAANVKQSNDIRTCTEEKKLQNPVLLMLSIVLGTQLENNIDRDWLSSLSFPPKHHRSPVCCLLPRLHYKERERAKGGWIFLLGGKGNDVPEDRQSRNGDNEKRR